MKNIIIILFFVCMATSTTGASDINKDNWMSHPKIKKIRKLYKSIVEKSNNGDFKTQHIECELHNGNVIIEATIFRGKNNVVRKYVLDGGTGDSTAYGEYYYTEKSQLRFTFLRRKAVNGTHLERRIYFDDQNKILYEDYRLLEGPGYFRGFPKQILDPEKDFRELCIDKN